MERVDVKKVYKRVYENNGYFRKVHRKSITRKND
jgi:hypothetical protein